MQAMTGNGERRMETYPKDAWQRLGHLLKQRRPKIDPRYRIRRTFAEENHLTDKTVQEIENAYRETFSTEMLGAVEVAYRLPAGTIRHVLSSPDVQQLPELPTGAQRIVGPIRPSGPVEIPAEVSLQDLAAWEQHLWHTPDLTVEERQIAIHTVRLVRGIRTGRLDRVTHEESVDALSALVSELMKWHPSHNNGSTRAG
jgi:hypothetical protein